MEGFFGMLYIHETPLHHALILTSGILLLLVVFAAFSATSISLIVIVIFQLSGIINNRAKPSIPQS